MFRNESYWNPGECKSGFLWLFCSETPSDRTLQRRGEELIARRSAVTGGSAGSAGQQAYELRRMEKEERERLLQTAGLLLAVQGTRAAKESGLALKTDLHLPW